MGSDDPSPTPSMLTDAFRAKDERLNRLYTTGNGSFTTCKAASFTSLYAIQTGLNAVRPSRERTSATLTHLPAGLLRKRVKSLIRAVRDKIFALERDTATGFELEAELRQLVSVCRHFGDMMITLSIDPHAASLLTREESRHLLHIAQAVTFDSLRRYEASRLTIGLKHINGRVCFD